MGFFRDAASEVDEVMRADLALVENELLGEVLSYGIFNGGKRIRPQLTMLCWALTDKDSGAGRDQALQLAIVFEYLHAASLLHDDVIDNAEQRRGKPSANVVWGISPVILAGDYLHSRAMTLAGKHGGRQAMALAGHATAAMVESEFLQMQSVGERNLSEENYYKVVAGKTGALIAAACETGVLLANGSSEKRKAIRLYGENIGLAFQIVDDLLDYQGDPGRTGKAVGNDLVEGKMTLPLIHAFLKASAGDRKTLTEILAAPPEERLGRFGEARGLIEKYDGFAYARQRALEVIGAGSGALDSFAAGREREILVGLADYVLSRDK
ncbi:MAG: polyprenyl synthetase family protein [Thermodesulfobacteriota bacterium]